jgi:hypothetical protein
VIHAYKACSPFNEADLTLQVDAVGHDTLLRAHIWKSLTEFPALGLVKDDASELIRLLNISCGYSVQRYCSSSFVESA